MEPEDFAPWSLLTTNAFSMSFQCVQFHETTSNERGEFRFDQVLRTAKHAEIYYTHSDLPPQRFPNLQLSDVDASQHFELQAAPTTTVALQIQLDKYPKADAVKFRALGDYQDEPKQAIVFSEQEFGFAKLANGVVEIPDVPSGQYEVWILGPTEQGSPFAGGDDNPFGASRQILLRQKISVNANQPRVEIKL